MSDSEAPRDVGQAIPPRGTPGRREAGLGLLAVVGGAIAGVGLLVLGRPFGWVFLLIAAAMLVWLPVRRLSPPVRGILVAATAWVVAGMWFLLGVGLAISGVWELGPLWILLSLASAAGSLVLGVAGLRLALTRS